MQRTICLYCGSRAGAEPAFLADAEAFGAALAGRGWRLIYGGGNVGLMGAAARTAIAYGAEVVGVIPRGLMEREQGLDAVDELIVTETLRERKGIMFERSDAFVCLPGGFGTLEEVVETLTLRQLRYHNKPIVFLNSAGYYDPLIQFFTHAVETGFIHPSHLGLYGVVHSVPELIDWLDEQLAPA